MLQLVSTGMTHNTFINSGVMLDCKFINDKFNYYSEDKKIDFHRINYSNVTYVNLGDEVTAEEVNDIINNK
jgi:hypothetical protein